MWHKFYAERIGLSMEEAGLTPIGELCDMIACYQIEHGAKEAIKRRVHDATEVD